MVIEIKYGITFRDYAEEELIVIDKIITYDFNLNVNLRLILDTPLSCYLKRNCEEFFCFEKIDSIKFFGMQFFENVSLFKHGRSFKTKEDLISLLL